MKIVKLAWITQICLMYSQGSPKVKKEGKKVKGIHNCGRKAQRDTTLLALKMEKGSHEPRKEGGLSGWETFSVQHRDTTVKSQPLPLPSHSSHSAGIDKSAAHTGCNVSNEEKPKRGGQRV